MLEVRSYLGKENNDLREKHDRVFLGFSDMLQLPCIHLQELIVKFLNFANWLATS